MVRQATAADVDALLALGRIMHAEAPALRGSSFDETKVRRVLNAVIDGGAAFVHEDVCGAIDGGLVGMVLERWYSTDKVATDLGVFVKPDKRGGFIAYRLVRAFVTWSTARALPIEMGASTGVAPEVADRLYTAIGFERIGGAYRLPIANAFQGGRSCV